MMSVKTQRYKTVLRQYEQIRWKKEQEWKKRKQDIYTLCPRLEQIESEISLTGVKIARMVLQKPENTKELLQQLEQSIIALREEKKNSFLHNLEFHKKRCK